MSRSVTNINFGKTETQEQEEESSFFIVFLIKKIGLKKRKTNFQVLEEKVRRC